MRMVSDGQLGHGSAKIGFGGGKDYLPALVFASHFSCFSYVFGPIEVQLLVRDAAFFFWVVLVLYRRLHFLYLGFCDSKQKVARKRDSGVSKAQRAGNFGLFSFSLGFRQFLCVLFS